MIAAATIYVSRETRLRLEVIVRELTRWQEKINLIAPATLPDVWTRHVEDSLQLWPLATDTRKWIDLGSGGGFPGLPIAAVLAEVSGGQITLVESNGKKCAFLREVARIAALPATVIHARIETLPARFADEAFDVVTARALAPLPELLKLAAPLIKDHTIGLFPKGEDVDDELRNAMRGWQFKHDLIDSQTAQGARIVRLSQLTRRAKMLDER
ncbi:MAG: 16S rRNA (guanine(527)-N(7))-methyltransferase RsmG [Beijerinckiaceae bacterium]